MEDTILVNETPYRVLRLLGKGKGGYSYLVEQDGHRYVLKQIHHEPCDYYTFGNKIEAEQTDYHRLLQLGIPMPKLLDIDTSRERILKQYIDGPTIYDLVKTGDMKPSYFEQVRQMAKIACDAGLNIDYFPTNFVVEKQTLFYIDYECNPYADQWNFENWGIQYWSKTSAFMEYLKQNPHI